MGTFEYTHLNTQIYSWQNTHWIESNLFLETNKTVNYHFEVNINFYMHVFIISIFMYRLYFKLSKSYNSTPVYLKYSIHLCLYIP